MQNVPSDNKSPQHQPLSPKEKKDLADLVKFLSRAIWQCQSFGINHPLAKQPIDMCFPILNSLIQQKGDIVLYIAEKKIRYDEIVLEDDNPVVDRLVDLFSSLALVSIEFQRGFTQQDFLNLLGVLSIRAQDILASGGIEKLVEEKKVAHIKLNPIKYELIGMDEKIVSTDAKTIEVEGDMEELKKKLAEWQSGEVEETADDELFKLIDASLKEDSDQSMFIDMLIKDPLEEVHLIIEAIRVANKVGGEKAKAIIRSVTSKLSRVRDDLYMCVVEGREDENTEYIYRSSEMLGKELARQVRSLKVSEELGDVVEEMNSMLSMIMDQTEARKIINTAIKGEITLKKKAYLLKKTMQRQKVSPDFEFLIKKLLSLKGVPANAVDEIFSQKQAILELLDKEKEAEFAQDLRPELEKLLENETNVEEALSKLNEIASHLAETQIKSSTKKIEQEKDKLSSQAKAYSIAFSDIDEGVVIFDEEGRIIFINEPGQRLFNLKINDKIDKQLISALEGFRINKSASAENVAEGLSKVMSQLKSVRRDEESQLNIAIFRPLT